MEMNLAEAGTESPAPKGSLRWIARQLLLRAGEETAAAREIGDRLDGKPATVLENGDDPFEVIHRIERAIVDIKPE
jgi:hypothetical protein